MILDSKYIGIDYGVVLTSEVSNILVNIPSFFQAKDVVFSIALVDYSKKIVMVASQSKLININDAVDEYQYITNYIDSMKNNQADDKVILEAVISLIFFTNGNGMQPRMIKNERLNSKKMR